MTSKNECFVYMMLPETTEFVTAARFRISKTDQGESVGEFVYGKNYLSNPSAVELDPIELKLSSNAFQTTRMHGFFGAVRDAMPDFWGRRVIEKNVNHAMEEFDFLLQGPDDRAGALSFGLNVKPPAPHRQFNRTLNLAVLQETAEAIMNNQSLHVEKLPDQEQVRALLLQGTSMGGARPKAVIEEQKHLWIAKFSSSADRWNQPRVEHAFLQLAKKCGLHVAESKVIRVADKDVLLVKRFDREYAHQNYFRYRMISALTLLMSDDSPAIHTDWSYLSLADAVRRISAHPTEDLRELFGRICFNALVSNLDDHPRNHAVIAKSHEWRLSPAYDLTPTITFSQERFLAMTCGVYGRLATRENILSEHGRFLLSKIEAENIADHIVKVVQKEWMNCLRRTGLTEAETNYFAPVFQYDGFFYERAL